mmetsp:Transcript_1300/g.1725  ORF Transcript_1300/g.1725 Transcript_1300/m.1725 type:complete len:346 (-) Transcript_1300:436-1473(-)
MKEIFMFQHIQNKRLVGGDSSHTEFLKSTAKFFSCINTCRCLCCHLDKQRIIVRGNVRAHKSRSIIQTNTHTTWSTENLNNPSVWAKIFGWIFRSHTALHCMAHWENVFLFESHFIQFHSRSNLDLTLNYINSSDLLSNGVLNLNTRVDFNEIMSTFTINQKFHCSRIFIVGSLEKFHGVIKECLTCCLWKSYCWTCFNYFLVPSLYRAIAVIQVHSSTSAITKHLDFNMARFIHITFNEHGAIAECSSSFTCSSGETLFELFFRIDHSHSFSSSTHSSFDNYRVADPRINEFPGFFDSCNCAITSGHNLDTTFDCNLSRRCLVSKSTQIIHSWANKSYTSICTS